MATGLDGRGKGIIGLEFCDVVCDVTLACKPVPLNPGYPTPPICTGSAWDGCFWTMGTT